MTDEERIVNRELFGKGAGNGHAEVHPFNKERGVRLSFPYGDMGAVCGKQNGRVADLLRIADGSNE